MQKSLVITVGWVQFSIWGRKICPSVTKDVWSSTRPLSQQGHYHHLHCKVPLDKQRGWCRSSPRREWLCSEGGSCAWSCPMQPRSGKKFCIMKTLKCQFGLNMMGLVDHKQGFWSRKKQTDDTCGQLLARCCRQQRKKRMSVNSRQFQSSDEKATSGCSF